MKQCFKILVWGAIGVLFLGGLASANPMVGVSSAKLLPNEELKTRFLAAVIRAREPQTGISEWQRLAALRFIEKKSGLNLGVARMMEDASAREPGLLSGVQRAKPRGIGRHPKAASLDFDMASRQMGSEFKMNDTKIPSDVIQRDPRVKMVGFFMLAATIIDECRSEEKKVNEAFLARIFAQPWPVGTGNMMAGSLALRLFQHGCISRADFDKVLKPILPSIYQLIASSETLSSDLAGVLYFLVEADAMDGVTHEQLVRFVHAQADNGSWADASRKKSESAYAAFGAAVLARILSEREVKFTNDDVLAATKNPPKLTLLKSNLSSR